MIASVPKDAPECIKYVGVKVALQSVTLVQGKRRESNIYKAACFHRVCCREFSLIFILGEWWLLSCVTGCG